MACRFYWAILILAAVATNDVTASQQPQDIAEWRHLTFTVPDGYPNCVGPYYNPENLTVASDLALIRGIEPACDRIFITIPRTICAQGYYYSLGYIPSYIRGNFSCLQDPPIQAYPSWEWHSDAEAGKPNCSAFVSVTHARIDKCNRLWVLDSGLSSIVALEKPCPSKLVVFDLSNDQVVKWVDFPDDISLRDSWLAYIALDERYGHGTSCDDLTVYIGDASPTAAGIISYNVQTDTFIRRCISAMFPDPKKSTIKMADGDTFKVMRAVMSLEVAPPLDCACDNNGDPCDNTDLYFQAFTDNRLYSCSISDFNNKEYKNKDLNATLVTSKTSQSAAMGRDVDQLEILFATTAEDNVWGYQPGCNNLRVREHHPVKNDLVIDLVYDGGCLWTANINMAAYFKGTVNPCITNQRISVLL